MNELINFGRKTLKSNLDLCSRDFHLQQLFHSVVWPQILEKNITWTGFQ